MILDLRAQSRFLNEEVPYETVANVLFNVMQTAYINCFLLVWRMTKIGFKTSAREWNDLGFIMDIKRNQLSKAINASDLTW